MMATTMMMFTGFDPNNDDRDKELFASVIARAIDTRWRKLIWKIARLFPVEVIWGTEHREKGPLMLRFDILHLRSLRLYFHLICRSDADRDPHDHPWDFRSLILSGGYWEHTPYEQVRHLGRFTLCGYMPMGDYDVKPWYGAGTMLKRPATWIHKLEMERPTWTLVLCSATSRKWGFHTKTGFCFWKNYRNGECCE